MRGRHVSDIVFRVLGILLVAVFAAVTVVPLGEAVMIAIKPMGEFTLNPTGFPTRIRFENFVDAWNQSSFGVLLVNTLVVTAATVALVIALSSPAGFALSKLRLKGEKVIYNYFLLGLIIPFQAIMIPLLKTANALHATNMLPTLILVYTGTNIAFPILLYTGFYKSLPYEIIEAAKIDGCGTVKLFLLIVFPMTASINLTVTIFTAMVPWRDFFVPLIFINEDAKRTLSIGLFSFQRSYFREWTTTFAMVLMMSLPLILLYVFAQKSFVKGITAGAVKG